MPPDHPITRQATEPVGRCPDGVGERRQHERGFEESAGAGNGDADAVQTGDDGEQ